ncbi:MAG: hypothetical protein EOO43_08130 [Flavobacterium sp.]|nr:MAG: hypothetical protein EOO43_08130 [Flavobacterium sp.]
MKKIIFSLTLAFMLFFSATYAQHFSQDSAFRKFFIGSTLFVLGNLTTKNPPGFAQLNFGYRINQKNTVSLELKTWKYAWSLGIPYGKTYEAPEEKFPGYIRENGFALAYQRYWWKGFYTGVHVMSAWQKFVNKDGEKIDNGFQIFNTYRVGYQVKLFKNRYFIEPSIAVTHRPYHTEMPAQFKQLDDKWSKFFFGEPGLHFGINF